MTQTPDLPASEGGDPAPEAMSAAYHPDDVLPPADVLDAGERRPSRRARRGLAIGGAAVLVGVLAGGAFALSSYLSGGGVQPEDLMPSSVVAYADLDLDPAAGQKANILRLASTFSDVDARLGDQQGIRSYLLETFLGKGSVDPVAVDSWLGDRFGVGVLNVGQPGSTGSGTPQVVVAIQVTDEQAAKTWIEGQLKGQGTVATTQGYVLVGSPGVNLDQVMAEAAQTSLAENPTFRDSMDRLGDGVAQAYVDVPALEKSLPSALGLPGGLAGTATSPVSLVARVDPDAIEVLGTSSVPDGQAGSEPTQLLAGLPSSTAAALAVTGLGQQIASQLDTALAQAGLPGADQQVKALEQQTGLTLPDDLKTLFGDDLVVAADGTDLLTSPQIGVRVTTDPTQAARVVGIVKPLIAEATGGYGLDVRSTSDGWLLATTPGWGDQLASGSGGFLEQPQVKAALPDVAGAGTVLYLDFAPLRQALAAMGGSTGGDTKALDHLGALGITISVDGSQADIRARLTVQ